MLPLFLFLSPRQRRKANLDFSMFVSFRFVEFFLIEHAPYDVLVVSLTGRLMT